MEHKLPGYEPKKQQKKTDLRERYGEDFYTVRNQRRKGVPIKGTFGKTINGVSGSERARMAAYKSHEVRRKKKLLAEQQEQENVRKQEGWDCRS